VLLMVGEIQTYFRIAQDVMFSSAQVGYFFVICTFGVGVFIACFKADVLEPYGYLSVL